MSRDLDAAVVVLRDVLTSVEAGDPDAARCALAAADAARGVVPVLTVAEVAQTVRLSEDTIRRAIDAGTLAAVHPGGGRAVRVPVAAVHAYLFGKATEVN